MTHINRFHSQHDSQRESKKTVKAYFKVLKKDYQELLKQFPQKTGVRFADERYWVADFTYKGNRHYKNFSVSRFGFLEARKMAIDQREQWQKKSKIYYGNINYTSHHLNHLNTINLKLLKNVNPSEQQVKLKIYPQNNKLYQQSNKSNYDQQSLKLVNIKTISSNIPPHLTSENNLAENEQHNVMATKNPKEYKIIENISMFDGNLQNTLESSLNTLTSQSPSNVTYSNNYISNIIHIPLEFYKCNITGKYGPQQM